MYFDDLHWTTTLKPGQEWPLYNIWVDDHREPCLECGRDTFWRYPNGGAVCGTECQQAGYRKSREIEKCTPTS